MKRSTLATVAAFAVAGGLMAFAFGGGFAVVPSRDAQAPKPRRSTVQWGGDGWCYRSRGPGWSHAQVQRMARKRRNQARHKRHCRRARS